MKRAIPLLLALCLLLGGCTDSAPSSSEVKKDSPSSQVSQGILLTDSNGTKFSIPDAPRVVSLYGSYAEAWQLAGGELVGATEDAIEERGLELGETVSIVGTVKEPNTEEIIALDPDLVILSSDIAAQNDIRDVLESAGLSCAYFRVDTFADYASMMEQFCKLTGRDDLYEENVKKPEQQIEDVKMKAHASSHLPSALLIRAFSTGIKAKTDDELAGAILKNLGAQNIADEHPSMLEDLSMEEVIAADPEFIFVTTMGSEKKALEYLDSLIAQNPAWSELSAVKNGNYIILPKDLFHYKPNNRWGDSYEYLAKILYPTLYQE